MSLGVGPNSPKKPPHRKPPVRPQGALLCIRDTQLYRGAKGAQPARPRQSVQCTQQISLVTIFLLFFNLFFLI